MNSVFKAAVIGDPIDHSWSPFIFSFLSQRLAHPIFYQRLKISGEDWEKQQGLYSELQTLQGWNVTLPLKKKVLARLDSLSEEAEVIGAVNVVHRLPDFCLKGYNTDVLGVIHTLSERKIQVQGQVAVLFGAGGAARAAAYALGKMKAKEVRVLNRTHAHAQALLKPLQRVFPDTTFLNISKEGEEGDEIQFMGEPSQRRHLISDPVSLYINATPIGMKGYPQYFDLCQEMNPQAFAFDLVYSAEITPFLAQAQAQGLSFVGGLDMLVWQALATWEIWIGPLEQSAHLKVDLMQHLQNNLRLS